MPRFVVPLLGLVALLSPFLTIWAGKQRVDEYKEWRAQCRKELQVCEARCAQDNPVGSLQQFKCNDRCREDYLICREEGP
jgi:hypothetical protein